ncbi:MAG TPA: tetratricopeptide repeat protein [Pyrinomonadaceae bacterium]
MKKLILTAFVCLLPHAARAQTTTPTPAPVPVQGKSTPGQPAELQEADKLNASVYRLYAEGNYKEALPLAERALALSEKVLKDEDPLVGVALHNLAAVYIALGEMGKVERLCERILVRREQGRPPTSKATMNALTAYACIFSAKGWLRVGNGKTLSDRINKILLEDAIVAAGLTPPANLEGAGERISAPPPTYPRMALNERRQGTVFIMMDIDGAGGVMSAEPLPCVPALRSLAEAAAGAAHQSKFAPVSIAGTPITRKAFAIYNFVIK